MARTSNRVIWENSLKVLTFVREESAVNRERLAPLSYRQIAACAGVSVQQARFLCARLEEDGFMTCSPRYAPDGGRLANGYALTSRGRLVLREFRRIEAVV